jgi:glycosyltransferase involved in cell wall biosynthesis
MKTVAVVSGFEPFKGSTLAARAYYDAFRDLGYEPHWYQCGTGTPRIGDGSERRWVPGITVGNRSLDQALNFGYFYSRRIGTLSEDIVLLTDSSLLQMADANPGALVLFHDLREFHLRTMTNPLAPFLSFYLLSKLRHTRGILGVSEATRKDLRDRLARSPPIEVVHTASPVTGDGPGHVERSLRRLTGGRSLQALYVAVDRPYKHVRFVIDLARALDACGADRDFRIVVVSKLRRSTLRYLARDRPRCLTILPEVNDVSTVYQESDVLLFPSEFEGFGFPLVEAMSLGLPVVAHPAPAIEEVLGAGGLLVPGYELGAWVRALRDLRDPAGYRRWSARALERASRFTASEFRQRLAEVLSRWGI